MGLTFKEFCRDRKKFKELYWEGYNKNNFSIIRELRCLVYEIQEEQCWRKDFEWEYMHGEKTEEDIKKVYFGVFHKPLE